MKKALLLFFIGSVQLGFAQFGLLPNGNLTGQQSLPCPFNNNQTTLQVPGWQFYQTTNNEWNGPVDSLKCINATLDHFQETAVALSDIDVARFLFCRLVLNSPDQIPLSPNSVFNAGAQFDEFPDQLQTGNCDSVPCNQIILQVDIPDSAGTGRSARTYTGTILDADNFDPLFCFSTERFNDQHLKSFVVQVNAKGSNADTIRFFNFSVQGLQFGSPYYLTDSMVAQYNNRLDLSAYPYTNNGFGAGGTLLALYSDSTYPGPNNYSYLRIFPTNPYDTAPQVITVTMDPGFDLMFQPYTEFVPAKVYHDPDSTHSLNFLLHGSTICLSPFIEEIIDSRSKLTYKSGHVDFGGEGSCMQFRPGATLEVSDSATFDYGEKAKPGIMLLRENSTIVLDPYSTLNIYAEVVLNEYDRSKPGQFYMTLPPTTTLRFMPGSVIIADWSINASMKLNVYMKGGTLDDSGLPDYAKPYINRIYDEQDVVPALTGIFPNPSSLSTMLKITTAQDEQGTVDIFNLQGQLVYNTILQLQKGINISTINYGSLASGEYIVRVKNSSIFIGKMIVLN